MIEIRHHRRRGRLLLVLDGDTLAGADLRGQHLAGADLRGRDLRRANLQWANLVGADLRGADLGDATLVHAEVIDGETGAIERPQTEEPVHNCLAGTVLTGARYDRFTGWPEGFDPQAHGARLDD